jgi:hypothetical protein
MMTFFPPLPIPSQAWLRSTNTRYRGGDVPPIDRPFCAMEEWAALHGQPSSFGRLMLSQLGGSAWAEIDSFFKAFSKLGDERMQPLKRFAWFYDGSFYEGRIPMILGGPGAVSTINPFTCVEGAMPKSLLQEFSRDDSKIQEYLDHLSNCVDCFLDFSWVAEALNESLSKDLLQSAERHLDSAISGLLATPPNPQAAGHARLTFEISLKALAAEKGNLTKSDGISISHRLDKLFNDRVAHFTHLIPTADFLRMKEAATRSLFPRHDAHYESAIFSHDCLWKCYSTAQHAYATVLRALGASDSRAFQMGE